MTYEKTEIQEHFRFSYAWIRLRFRNQNVKNAPHPQHKLGGFRTAEALTSFSAQNHGCESYSHANHFHDHNTCMGPRATLKLA